MIQFGSTAYSTFARFNSRSTRLSPRLVALFASSPTTAPATDGQLGNRAKEEDSVHAAQAGKEQRAAKTKVDQQKAQVDVIKQQLITLLDSDERLVNSVKAARSVNDLLNMAKRPNQSVHVSLQIMSVVTSAINSGKMSVTKAQENAWMPVIQNLLTSFNSVSLSRPSADNSEFSKLENLSVPAMIQVITSLSVSRQRHSPLLRFLTKSIVKNADRLTPRLCTSLLYSMCSLNFPDEELIEKTLKDLMSNLKNVDVPILISAMRSLGTLRYRHDVFLDAICPYIQEHKGVIKPTEYTSIAITFATFNKVPVAQDLLEDFKRIPQSAVPAHTWLDLVWALVILRQASKQHYKSVLTEDFFKQLKKNFTVPKMLKLQNINAAASYLVDDYKEPLLSTDNKIFDAMPLYTKEKQKDAEALDETLAHYLKSSSCFKTRANLGLGFLIDAIVHLDSSWNGVDVKDENASHKVAFILDGYEYYSLGTKKLLGVYAFQKNLLQAMGYHVLDVSYDCFSSFDKLSKREAYVKLLLDSLKQQPEK